MNPATEKLLLSQIPDLPFSKSEEEEVMKLAAVGFMPKEIASAMEWPQERRAVFVLLSNIPDSSVANLLEAGRALGRATPQKKLQEAASAGNVEAIKALQTLQLRNRFNELLTLMDDDEFTP